MTREDLIERISQQVDCIDDIILFDGLENACKGLTYDGDVCRLIYCSASIINIFIEQDEMTPDEAEEFYSYNTARAAAYLGDKGPILMDTLGEF